MAADLAGLMEALSLIALCSWQLLCASMLAGSDRTLLPAATVLLPSSVCTPCTKMQGQISAIARPLELEGLCARHGAEVVVYKHPSFFADDRGIRSQAVMLHTVHLCPARGAVECEDARARLAGHMKL